MKKIYFAIALIAATFCLSPMTASAQDPEPEDNGVFLDKYVTGPDANGQYLITLESYATGQTVKSESTIIPPLNIVILLDVSKAMHTNQQDAVLKTVIPSFVSGFPAPTDPSKSHNISIVYFDDIVRRVMHNVSSADSQEIADEISKYNNNKGGSKPDYAFAAAIEEIQGFIDGGSTDPCTVIYFSATNRKENNNLEFRAENCKNAVNLSYVLKKKGSLGGTKSITMDDGSTLSYTQGLDTKVFSISEIKALKEEENQVRHLMNFVSSLYPDKWMTNTSDFTSTTEGTEYPPTDPKYHQFAGSVNEIAGMFETVKEEIIQPVIPINASSIVRDILTPDFQLPEGVSLTSGVKVYTQDCIYSGAPNYTISFKEQRNEITDKVTVSVSGDGNRTIDVVGFDFAEHYCGYDEVQKVKTPHEGGQKLVITIPIETVADYQGGYDVPTNAQGSGIYPADSEQPLEEFDVPSVDFPSIGIIKNGLKVGESATFTVQRTKDEKGTDVTENPFNIILTCTETGKPAYVILKNLKEGTYRVAESTWSWTYEVTEVTIKDGDDISTITPSGNEATVSTQVLAESQTEEWPSGINETVKCVLFTFTNAKKTGDDNTIYAESVVKNKFIGGSSSSASATTINSKDQN